MPNDTNPSEEELCLVDSCTTNTVLIEIKYFQTLRKRERNVLTIAGRDALIVGSEKAIITLPMGTQILIEDALLYPESTCTLLSYRDVRKNGIHVKTYEKNSEEYLLFTKLTGNGKQICNFLKCQCIPTWHDIRGHPGIGMMRKIITSSIGPDLTTTKFLQNSDFVFTACATGKLILRQLPLKIRAEPLQFLKKIKGDICDPIEPASGPFGYFMVLIDASTRWSHVCLLSTQNHVFVKIMSQLIKLKARYPEHRIKSI
ncbi:hypothetical protein BS78_03G178100 [Paspalum vaginatum]|nr:hypothetical protein BS78_03G178100 [Paspalum vaginatum]